MRKLTTRRQGDGGVFVPFRIFLSSRRARVGWWGVAALAGLTLSTQASAEPPLGGAVTLARVRPHGARPLEGGAVAPAVVASGDGQATSEARPASGSGSDEPHESGVGILGFEGVIGQDRGAVSAEGQGAQLGMRFPFEYPEMKMRLDLLFGGRPYRGLMGEVHMAGDSRWGKTSPGSSLVGGLWGFELMASQGSTVWYSLIEVPRAHLGYRYTARESGFELGGRAGLSLIGRYNPQGATSALGNSVTPGFYALAYSGHFYATWETRSFSSLSGGRPTWLSEGLLCGTGSGMAACLSSRYFVGRVSPDDGAADRLASSWQIGLMLGLGERLGLRKE